MTEDQGILSSWITWPTLHRGVSIDEHCISAFGQDLAGGNAEYQSFMDLLARAGIKIGVFGSPHAYPLPENTHDYSLFVPDTIANGPECFPESLTPFQDFNLRMMDTSGRNVTRTILLGPAARFLANVPALSLANVPIQDDTWSFADRISDGIVLPDNPSEPRSRSVFGDEISTREIAPTMVTNFNVRRPGYSMSGLA